MTPRRETDDEREQLKEQQKRDAEKGSVQTEVMQARPVSASTIAEIFMRLDRLDQHVGLAEKEPDADENDRERLDTTAAADLIAEADSIDDTDELKRLIKAERSGKNRTTVIDAFKRRLDELKSDQ